LGITTHGSEAASSRVFAGTMPFWLSGNALSAYTSSAESEFRFAYLLFCAGFELLQIFLSGMIGWIRAHANLTCSAGDRPT
jgi:hypothetical protein